MSEKAVSEKPVSEKPVLDQPTPPGDYECCESACEPCVWDIYYEDMREWKEAQEKLKAAQAEDD